MSVPVIAFFNNKGGVGKTSLLYHLAWMCSDLGVRTLAADLDPQANLTSAFLDEDQLEVIWSDDPQTTTIHGCIRPLVEGDSDIAEPATQPISPNLALLAGSLSLSGFEDELSQTWTQALDRKPRAFRIWSALWRTMQRAALQHSAQLILMDLGPNLGAINRASLISADYVVVPLSPDLFSLQGLRNLGPSFKRWREEWQERLDRKPGMDIDLPGGHIQPLGYVVMQHGVRLSRPVKAYDKWASRIPEEYRTYVLGDAPSSRVSLQEDPHLLALLKHYRSLMPMAQEARKPMFHLKPSDGAIGAHFQAVRDSRGDFQKLAETILRRANLPSATEPSAERQAGLFT
jgi:cellulose biosynthesis protein BcsQ